MTTHDNTFSVVQTLMLLNSTHRKLQCEENIYDSSSPLRYIHLSHMSQRLNDHLYNEQAVQVRSPVCRDFAIQRAESIVTAEPINEDDEDEEEDDTTIPEYCSIIEIDAPDEVEDVESKSAGISTFTPKVRLMSDALQGTKHEEVHAEYADAIASESEIDISDIEYSGDMPTLTRQENPMSIPALYHSDGTDSSDDEDQFEEGLGHHADANRYSKLRPRLTSHVASDLIQKNLFPPSFAQLSLCA